MSLLTGRGGVLKSIGGMGAAMTNMVLGGQGDGQGADKPLSMADVVKQAAAGQYQMSNHFFASFYRNSQALKGFYAE